MWKFQNVPNSIIDLYNFNLICPKFGTFTITGVIAPKDYTYPPDYTDQKKPIMQSYTLKLSRRAIRPFNPATYDSPSLVADSITNNWIKVLTATQSSTLNL